MLHSVYEGRLDCLKYLVEEAKTPLNDWIPVAFARYFKRPECLHYLREKECPEPTDEVYADFAFEYDEVSEEFNIHGSDGLLYGNTVM